MSSTYSVRKTGQPNTPEYRVYIEKDGVPISSWHDIPLYADKEQRVLNMVVEIPRWTYLKFEIAPERHNFIYKGPLLTTGAIWQIARNEYLNPIKQDMKNGKLRFVRNRFPWKGYMWNYGALPCTWEDPGITLPESGTGDNDPLDACEIGEQVAYTGQVKQVKVLGLNGIADVETYMPGLLSATTEWFQYYKVPDGKPENKVAFSGQFKDREYAINIVHECSESWDRLINGKTQPGEISLSNVTNNNTPHQHREQSKVPSGGDLEPASLEENIDKWFFVPENVIRRRYGSL